MQKHHIIPLHMNGPNEEWNLVTLSVEEHAYAHKLLFENYLNYYDLSAACMLSGQANAGFEAIRKANQLKMEKNKKGFYNPDLQRELGKRPKKKRNTYARNIYVKAALKKGMILQWIKTNEIVVIEPLEFSSLVDVVGYLMTFPQMIDKKESWDTCLKKEKHYSISGLTRTLTGHVDKKQSCEAMCFFFYGVESIRYFYLKFLVIFILR
jgi:hypothetical protein